MYNSGMGEHFGGVRVRVPATAANLGPGFDVLGLALTLYNTFTVAPSDVLCIEVEGYGVDLPRDESNLFYQAFKYHWERGGTSMPVPPVQIRMKIEVPPGKGLGSSATAVVGGLVAANAMVGHYAGESLFEAEMLLAQAVRLERGNHADNVAPALLGGLVVNAHDPLADKHTALIVPFPEELRVVLLTPDFAMDTVQGRALMPSHYSKEDVVYNTSRVALLLSALQTRRYDLLGLAMQDKMHQAYRSQVFRMMPALIRIALDCGAYGACLSGGGSSILALTGVEHAEGVGAGMLEAARAPGVGGEVRVLEADPAGAKATLL
ncbi:MAG: homoserine kinase [Chloroflexia bacterium]